MASKRYELNSVDLTKLATSAILVGVTAIGLFVVDVISLIDFSSLGQWAAPIGALATFGVNFLRKWLTDDANPPPPLEPAPPASGAGIKSLTTLGMGL